MLLFILLVVFCVCFWGAIILYALKSNEKEYIINGLTVRIPESWHYEEKIGAHFFFPRKNRCYAFIVSVMDFSSLINEYSAAGNPHLTDKAFNNYLANKETEYGGNLSIDFKGVSAIGGKQFYRAVYRAAINDNKYYINEYLTLFNGKIYSLIFHSSEEKQCVEFNRSERAILDSVRIYETMD